MSYSNRIKKAFENAPVLMLNSGTGYVFVSDCHRGVGNLNDNFLKNKNCYIAALQYYYRQGFTYIEVGDGDELWENRDLERIVELNMDVFRQLSLFQRSNRLYLLYGNHDMIKKNKCYSFDNCSRYSCSSFQMGKNIQNGSPFYEGVIIKSETPSITFNITHGHQADTLNSVYWRLSRFLVRHLWSTLEFRGIPDPTSAAKNNKKRNKVEKHLLHFARDNNCLLIAGHTHKPTLGNHDSPYYNCGSCVHPHSITCIELRGFTISLVEWHLSAEQTTLNTANSYFRSSNTCSPVFPLYVKREVLATENLLS